MSSKSHTLNLIIKSRAVGDGFDKLVDQLDSVNRNVGKLNRNVEQSRGSFIPASIAASLLTSAIISGFTAAKDAVVQFVQESEAAFIDFDRQTREVLTLLPNAGDTMLGELREQALATAVEIGRLPNEMLPAVYHGISLGIDPDNIFAQVELASKAARAGVSELTPTLKVGQSVVNAYGEDVISLNEVFDLMFVAVRDGATTIPELSQHMSQITSVAGETGVAFEDIISALVIMTRQGDDTAEAAQLLGIMLTQLGSEGTLLAKTFKEATNSSFRDFIAHGGNLIQAMDLLQRHADRTHQSLGNILGGSPFFRDTQAARAVIELTGSHLEALEEQALRTADSTGLVDEAYDKMSGSVEFSLQKQEAAWENVRIEAGAAFATVKADLAEDMIPLILDWADLMHDMGPIFIEMGHIAADALRWIKEGVGDLIPVIRLATGQYDHEITKMVLQNIKAADSIDGIKDALDQAREVTEAGNPFTVFNFEFNEDFAIKQAAISMAQLTNDFDLFRDEYIKLQTGVGYEELASSYSKNRQELAKSLSTDALKLFTAEQSKMERQAEATALALEKQSATLIRTQRSQKEAIERSQLLTTRNHDLADSARVASEFLQLEEQSLQFLVKTFKQSDALTADLLQSQLDLAEADGWIKVNGRWVEASEDAARRVEEANEAIITSYRELAFEALLAQTGVTESTVQLGVSLGLLTQEEADLRLEMTQVTAELTSLVEASSFATLTVDQQREAIELLTSGYVQNAETALWIVQNGGLLLQMLGEAKIAARDFKAELLEIPTEVDVHVRISTSGTIPTFPTGPVSGPYSDQYRDATSAGAVGFAAGGLVTGGIPGRDSVPAMLAPGEFVLTANEVRTLGLGNIDRFRSGTLSNQTSAASGHTFQFTIIQQGSLETDPYSTAQKVVELVGAQIK